MPQRPSRRAPGRVLAGVAGGLLLAGCGVVGGGSDPEPSVVDEDTAAAGVPVPELLSGVRCVADEEAGWTALGTVTNPGKNPASYQVTVQVGPAGAEASAVTRRLDDVAAGKTATFELFEIPAASADGPCHVQLLALPE